MSLNEHQINRYSRHLMLDDIGESGQEKLLSSHVLVVGLGGLGCPVALYLAAAGIGRLSLVDGDIVEESNLQRQVLYSMHDCGRLKVESARIALKGLNPEVEVVTYPEDISHAVLSTGFDVVVDCTDNLAARHLMNRYCFEQKVPMVSGSAICWEGQITTFDFENHRTPCFNCIVDQKMPEPLLVCGSNGVVGPVLGTMGSCQATAVLRLLLGFFRQHGELQRYDGKRGQWMNLQFTARSSCEVCGIN